MLAELLVLRVIHIIGGIFWVGSAIFTTLFLMPALAGSAAMGAVMSALTRRKLFMVLPINAVLVVLSGARLMTITAGDWSSYAGSARGLTYIVSSVFAVLSLVVSSVIGRPAGLRMATLAETAVSDKLTKDRIAAEIASLQRRVMTSSMFAFVLLMLTAVGMAVARHL